MVGAILWNTETGVAIRSVGDQLNRVEVATLDPSGQTIAFRQRGAVFIVGVSDGAITQRIGFEVSKTAFSSDAQTLCVAAGGGRIRVYRRGLTGYELRDEMRENGHIAAMAVISGQRLVFQVGSFIKNQSVIEVHHLETKKLKKFLPSAEQGIVNFIISTKDPNQVLMDRLFFDVKTGVYAGILVTQIPVNSLRN